MAFAYGSLETSREPDDFRRWLGRVERECPPRPEQLELVRAPAGALRTPFRELGVAVLEEACRELRIPTPKLTQ